MVKRRNLNFEPSELAEKTNAELREIARNMGISGVMKARKDDIIDRILEKQEENDAMNTPEKSKGVNALKSELTSIREDGDISTKIKVSCGGSSGMFNVCGKTVGEVSEFLREALNIDMTAQGLVNGLSASNSYVLKKSDILEFIKPAGQKG